MKLTKKDNYRIVVEPRKRIFGIELSEETQKSDLRIMEEQINRHVDNIGYMEVLYDTHHFCSHCNFEWEVSQDDNDPDFPKGTPLCCQKAIDEFNQQKSTL